ncbi:putative flavoprotein [Frankia sp. QA3]|nr:NAD(P)H-dependent oxidoreductase [Frankia sp. QA3]EIV93815.1 putative flavoprotein [Frankia sp. QA3]
MLVVAHGKRSSPPRPGPDYNRSFPASLKAAIDWHYTDWHYTEWQAKAIGFVGYSGGSGDLLAIEHLRQVFTELPAHPPRDQVFFPRYYELFTSDGAPRDPAGPTGAAAILLDQLDWWGSVLRDARRDRPFAADGGRSRLPVPEPRPWTSQPEVRLAVAGQGEGSEGHGVTQGLRTLLNAPWVKIDDRIGAEAIRSGGSRRFSVGGGGAMPGSDDRRHPWPGDHDDDGSGSR